MSAGGRGGRIHSVTFRLYLSADTYLRYYQGTAKDVLVTAEDGRTVRFPAHLLRGFVTPTGVEGRFRLLYDDAGISRGIERLD